MTNKEKILKEECYMCGNFISRDFRAVAIYCPTCGSLDEYDEKRLSYCNKCNCFCGCHPCRYTPKVIVK